MKYLYRTVGYLNLYETSVNEFTTHDGCLFYMYVKEEDGALNVTFTPERYTTNERWAGGICLDVAYGGVTKSVSEEAFTSPVAVSFAYSDECRSLTLSAAGSFAGMNLEADDYGASHTFEWQGGINDPAPEKCGITLNSLRAGTTAGVSGLTRDVAWTASYPEDKYAAVIHLAEFHEDVSEGETYYRVKKTAKAVENPVTGFRSSGYNDDRITVFAVIALYDTPDAARDDYIGLAEVKSRVITVAGAYSYLQPYDVAFPTPVRGAPITVTWTPPDDPKTGNRRYELQRSVNGGEFARVYYDASSAFTETVGDWEKVAYKVRATGYSSWDTSDYSPWSEAAESDVISTNIYIGAKGGIKPAAGIYVGSRAAVPRAAVG